jgi:hypothetical protein
MIILLPLVDHFHKVYLHHFFYFFVLLVFIIFIHFLVKFYYKCIFWILAWCWTKPDRFYIHIWSFFIQKISIRKIGNLTILTHVHVRIPFLYVIRDFFILCEFKLYEYRFRSFNFIKKLILLSNVLT